MTAKPPPPTGTPPKPQFNKQARQRSQQQQQPFLQSQLQSQLQIQPLPQPQLLTRTQPRPHPFQSHQVYQHQLPQSQQIQPILPQKATKTPYQRSNHLRAFMSEAQPNRVSSRFQESNKSISSNQFVKERLKGLVITKQPKPLPSKAEDQPSRLVVPQTLSKASAVSGIPELRRVYQPTITQTQAKTQPHPQPLTYTQQKQQPINLQYNIQQLQQTLYQQRQQSQHKTQNPRDYYTRPQLNLIQDTHCARNTQGKQYAGPLATATKAPLSVSQYTQPTPLPNNKSAHQISRAQSESNIKYQIKVNDKTYKVLRKIGSGGSAKVYEGFEPHTSQTVAIKIINVAQADPRTQESYFNEKSLLTKLRDSKHVVHLYDSEYKSDCKELIIVMEKGDADLSQVIDSYFKTKDSTIDGIFIKFYWRGMVQAVNDIHQYGIVHADLKPVNFILVKNEIKLIDFGIANAVDPENGTSIIRDYQIGTINYMAPESLRNCAGDASFHSLSTTNCVDENNQQNHKRTVIKYNSKVDIWSLGCILYNLVYGRPPFDKFKDLISKAQAIQNPRHVIEFPTISNQNLLNCMKSCLNYRPADRPSALELLQHPYLKEDVIQLQPQHFHGQSGSSGRV